MGNCSSSRSDLGNGEVERWETSSTASFNSTNSSKSSLSTESSASSLTVASDASDDTDFCHDSQHDVCPVADWRQQSTPRASEELAVASLTHSDSHASDQGLDSSWGATAALANTNFASDGPAGPASSGGICLLTNLGSTEACPTLGCKTGTNEYVTPATTDEPVQPPSPASSTSLELESVPRVASSSEGTASPPLALSLSMPAAPAWNAAGLALWELQPEEVEFSVNGRGERVVLGSGAGTKVYLGLWNSLQQVALKQPSPSASPCSMAEQVLTLCKLRNTRILSCFGLVPLDEGTMLVLEYMAGGSLEKAMQKGMTWSTGGAEVVLGVAEGLAYLHSRQLAHANLKPSNVLIGRSFRDVKLADVAPVGRTEGKPERDAACCAYIAPEVLRGCDAIPSSDIFSLGVMIHNLAGSQEQERLDCPPEVVDLAAVCLAPLGERPGIREVLQVLRA